MSENDEEAKKELRKLSARAMQLKMDLHDLSEELPQNWEKIPDIAERTYAAYRELHARRKAQAAHESRGDDS